MHPATYEIFRFFAFDHLPPGKLRRTSTRFYELAVELIEDEDLKGPELTVALRKLLEAKDAAVRAAL
jgi:hypothetical protein